MTKATELAARLDKPLALRKDIDEAAAMLRTQDDLLRQALEALEAGYHDKYPYVLKCKLAIDAIKEHLK